MDWPNNKDGVLLKRLASEGINLMQPHTIEFNVDFEHWPPSTDIYSMLKTKYGNVKLYEPGSLDASQDGYISVRIQSIISYKLVADMQRELTDFTASHGGYCDSWAVLLHHPEI